MSEHVATVLGLFILGEFGMLSVAIVVAAARPSPTGGRGRIHCGD